MIRIAIFDDHAIVRSGLRQYLGEHDDLSVVAEAESGRDAIALVRRGGIDVVLMDVSMPGLNGIDALRAIRARSLTLPVLFLSGLPEDQYAAALLRQGASGYLSKDCDPSEIVVAIRTVARGRRYITGSMAELLVSDPADQDTRAHHDLSQRELQVFLRLALGESVGDIGDSLSLRLKTVSTYRTALMRKLALRTNSDLTRYAIKNGLIR